MTMVASYGCFRFRLRICSSSFGRAFPARLRVIVHHAAAPIAMNIETIALVAPRAGDGDRAIDPTSWCVSTESGSR